ncbi:hypothetical protein J6590_038128 [Homalodisca vitripennis]|nr:hypothetical protein J6590_038128 [Homalodisca vitripennis]
MERRKFKFYADNSALQCLHGVEGTKSKLACWTSLLAGYDFDVIHVPGTSDQVADSHGIQLEIDTLDKCDHIQEVHEGNKCPDDNVFVYRLGRSFRYPEATTVRDQTLSVSLLSINRSIKIHNNDLKAVEKPFHSVTKMDGEQEDAESDDAITDQ